MPSDSAPSARATITSKRFAELAAAELHAILALRSRVFVVEQACVYNDIDGLDDDLGTVHHWIEVDGEVVAYARELHVVGKPTQLGRVVTDPAYRGRRHAERLVEHVCRRTTGPLTLEAQAHLVEWYERLGFATDGDEYVVDGIPHHHMRKG